ncbi:hypothetical protein FNH13_17610 [Ornithinimicrobium ciconiae]|uniref:Uncharacterized protein n=1 Tax=Ornithinimicrobium ciconiae TaxID=2594265 RepID=A0A516GEK0_9MICO|nr:hypothetical protein [Ornithinimicrobium ciconiae]QDO89918.1 hypothetical protein FNH13_17610 [Ornithinimicrobium ciconiae]
MSKNKTTKTTKTTKTIKTIKTVTVEGVRITRKQAVQIVQAVAEGRPIEGDESDAYDLLGYVAARIARRYDRRATAMVRGDSWAMDGSYTNYQVTIVLSARGGGWDILGEEWISVGQSDWDAVVGLAQLAQSESTED